MTANRHIYISAVIEVQIRDPEPLFPSPWLCVSTSFKRTSGASRRPRFFYMLLLGASEKDP